MRRRILTGDVARVLPQLAPASFDAVFCDPPYGLTAGKRGGSGKASISLASPAGRARIGTGNGVGGFMGMAWDAGIPGADVWRAVLRVLKPGAFLLAFEGTRTHHRLMCAIEDAGFEIKDCVMWLHGQGFPKSLDISKAIDKAAGAENIVGMKPDRWTGKGNALNFSSDRPQTECKVTAPATSEAVRWSGYGTALKPAWEPIIVAMRPCEGTFAANALKHGVAGLAIEAGRIPANGDKLNGGRISTTTEGWDRPWKHDPQAIENCRKRGAESVAVAESLGRWPANLILDEEAGAMLDRQSGILTSGNNPAKRSADKHRTVYAGWKGEQCLVHRGTDSGGASRFFYCAKASRRERGEGNNHPTVKPLKLCEYLARLILPPGRDTPRRLLVPFAGSGSEMLGALAAGWEHVTGIEQEPRYTAIARKRLKNMIRGAPPLYVYVEGV